MAYRVCPTRLVGCAILALVCGCSSLQTFRFDEVNPGMPVEVGDEVQIYLYGAQPGGVDFRVTAMTEQGIALVPVTDNGAQEVTYRWDDIARVDVEVFDVGKTTVLVVLGLLILDGAKELSDDLDDLFDIFRPDD